MRLSDSKDTRAGSSRASASTRSGGTVAVRWDAYAASQRPSARAASISARPAGRIRPAAINASARSTLIRDHGLPFRRGENRCRKWVSSRDLRWLSIQPWQMATSSASAAVTDACPEPFLAIFSHTSVSLAACAASQDSHSSASRKAIGSMPGLTPDPRTARIST